MLHLCDLVAKYSESSTDPPFRLCSSVSVEFEVCASKNYKGA